MRNKPRVAIITPGSFPIPSSRSSSVETVVDRLTNALKTEVEFTIFGKKSKELPFTENRGNISYIRFSYRNWTRYLTKVVLGLSKLNPQFIQIENRPKFVPLIRLRFPQAQILLTLHSTMFISNAHIQKDELIECLKLTDKIIVNSHFLKKFIVDNTGCEEDKIFVNHLGVDINQFQSKWHQSECNSQEKIKKQLNLDGKKILLFVGRLRKIKGIHEIIKALPAILKKVPDTVLIIAGSAYYGSARKTRYVDNLYELAKDVSDNIRFVSFIPHTEIHHWFEAADIVIVPSIGKEAFGLVNVEAMACGVPVIATKIGGMPEVIEHGRTGYLINPNNIGTELTRHVLNLLSNSQKTKELGENSVVRVKEYFTWENCANRLFGLYDSLS